MNWPAGVPRPSLIEALASKFLFFGDSHRIIRSGRVRTGGNAAMSCKYRYNADEIPGPQGVTYRVRGELRSERTFFSFDVDPTGFVTSTGDGDPYLGERFRAWLIDGSDPIYVLRLRVALGGRNLRLNRARLAKLLLADSSRKKRAAKLALAQRQAKAKLAHRPIVQAQSGGKLYHLPGARQAAVAAH